MDSLSLFFYIIYKYFFVKAEARNDERHKARVAKLMKDWSQIQTHYTEPADKDQVV